MLSRESNYFNLKKEFKNTNAILKFRFFRLIFFDRFDLKIYLFQFLSPMKCSYLHLKEKLLKLNKNGIMAMMSGKTNRKLGQKIVNINDLKIQE